MDHDLSRDHTGARLRPREADCIRLVPELISSKAIAARLGLKPDTVDGYIKAGMRRLGAADRYAAARMLHNLESPEGGTLLFGVPQKPGSVEPIQHGQVGYDRREQGVTPVDQVVREEAARYEPAFGGVGTGPFVSTPADRITGDRNGLTTGQRLREAARWTAYAILLFAALSVALLVSSAVWRQLGAQ